MVSFTGFVALLAASFVVKAAIIPGYEQQKSPRGLTIRTSNAFQDVVSDVSIEYDQSRLICLH